MEITLYTDASYKNQRYCISDVNGNPLWYGTFYYKVAHQAEAELRSAKKAVYTAYKYKEKYGIKDLKLILMTDARWITNQDSPKNKSYILTLLAKKYGISLDVRYVRSKENYADKYTKMHNGKDILLFKKLSL